MKFSFRHPSLPRTAEFHFHYPASFLCVRTMWTEEVVILTTVDHLTQEQRAVFVCYLHAEGFIDDFRPPSGSAESEWDQEQRLPRWIVDATWSEVDPMYALHIRQLLLCALGLGMAWLACITAWVYG